MNINESKIPMEILRIIKILNEKKQAIESAEISEQESNIEDYEKLLKDIHKRIYKIEKIKSNNELIEEILLLRIKLLDIIWHYEQLDEMLLKLIQKYDFE